MLKYTLMCVKLAQHILILEKHIYIVNFFPKYPFKIFPKSIKLAWHRRNRWCYICTAFCRSLSPKPINFPENQELKWKFAQQFCFFSQIMGKMCAVLCRKYFHENFSYFPENCGDGQWNQPPWNVSNWNMFKKWQNCYV